MSKCVKCGNEILTGDIHWEMGLCNNCYNELYKDHKTHISLDKMWLELAQDFRDENEKLQGKVSDLEAKLAEKEKQIEELKYKFDIRAMDLRLINNERMELKQQLAEYEKLMKKLNNEAQRYFEDAYCNDTIYQDKISFCIEQLEKVKEFLYLSVVDNEEIVQQINRQINQLKEGK